MIRVEFDPDAIEDPTLKAEWREWSKKAEEAIREAVEAWESWKASSASGEKFRHEFKDGIWGDLKHWLLNNVFHEKCAYCETPRLRCSFHVDHFRPKSRVRYRVGESKKLAKGACTDHEGREIDHPGYFWLAYHWRNLFPSCEYCNTAEGKKDQFPLLDSSRYILLKELDDETAELRYPSRQSERWPGFSYPDPRDLDDLEKPALLCPYADDDPRDHIGFGEHGIVYARNSSERGKHSIALFNLKDEKLREARQKAQEEALTELLLELLAKPTRKGGLDSMRAAKDALMARHQQGREPYSAAVLDYLALYQKQV
ncbi:MAG: hypothetical protein GY856_35070 [bacterium]|nr:hypothetical protein [bacterium]